MSYSVGRADGYSYVSDDLQSVLGEENRKGQRLNRIVIRARSPDLHLALTFDSEAYTPTRLEVTGSEQDAIGLLIGDVRAYVASCVTNVRVVSRWIRIPVLLLLALVLTRLVPAPASRPVDTRVGEVLKSQDVHVKLNYIIEHQATQNGDSQFLG